MYHKKKHGFTIIEFLLVIIMFGVLLGVILPRAKNAANEAKFSQILQHGSEVAGYIVTWAQNQIEAKPDNSPYTVKDFFLEKIDLSETGIESRPLVDRYTGNDHFDVVEKLISTDHPPKNPFNKTSYFDPVNDDPENVPSENPGLLYLASSVSKRINQDYRYFYLIITNTDGGWYNKADHRDHEAMQRGIFVAQMPEMD